MLFPTYLRHVFHTVDPSAVNSYAYHKIKYTRQRYLINKSYIWLLWLGYHIIFDMWCYLHCTYEYIHVHHTTPYIKWSIYPAPNKVILDSSKKCHAFNTWVSKTEILSSLILMFQALKTFIESHIFYHLV